MSVSTVPTVLARLLVLFKEAVEPSTEVWSSRTNEDHQQAENVYLGDVSGTREWASIGQKSREEDYEIAVEVEVFRDGTDTEGTEERMWEITAQLEQAIRTNVNLGLPAIWWATVSRFRSSNTQESTGTRVSNVFDIEVKARI